MSHAIAEPPQLPPVTEEQVRSHAARLIELAAGHGISELAFASAGRLRGHVDGNRDLFDVFEFQRAASDLVGGAVLVYSDGVLGKAHVSPDLVDASRCER